MNQFYFISIILYYHKPTWPEVLQSFSLFTTQRCLGLEPLNNILSLLFQFGMSFIGVVWYVEAVKDSFVFMVGTPPVFYTIHCLCESVNFHKLSFWLKIYAFLPFQTLNESLSSDWSWDWGSWTQIMCDNNFVSFGSCLFRLFEGSCCNICWLH